MKKAQTWSMDLIGAIMLFILIIGSVAFISISMSHKESVDELKSKAQVIYKGISSDGDVKFIDGSQVDVPALCSTIQKSYEDIKKEIGISEDFCIYFVDENGNLIYLDNNSEIPGIGSPRFKINGKACR